MKSLFFAVFLMVSSLATAQTDSLENEQINKDIWFNFMQAYHELDAALFNQIHTDDVLRVISDSQTILVGSEYKDRNLEVFNRWNSQRVNQTIEFSFISRSVKGEWAYQVGIYKLTRKNGLSSQSHYGKFHVTLQKVNGIWKIKTDADSSENGTIDEFDFQNGTSLHW